MNIKKFLIGFVASAIMLGAMVVPVFAVSVVNVYSLQPNWDAEVYSAYVGPPAYGYVSPGATAVYSGREAGIIKAGFNTGPADDEGLFAFIPNVTIDALAAGTLTYDVENETGVNPVWMTIEIDTGVVGDRSDNTAYQFVPTPNPLSVWNTFDAGAGSWLQWTTPTSGVTMGSSMTLSDVAAANTGLNVIRTYLRLGMGESYYNGGTGTTAWVDKATIGDVTYDFVVAPSVPVITLPANNSTVTVSNMVKVDWTDSAGGTPSLLYQYEVFSDVGYTSSLYDSGMTLSASEILTPGTPPGVYYVRVRAQDVFGPESAWSNGSGDPYKITVIADPVLVGPPTTFAQCKRNGWKTFNNPSFTSKSKCEKYVKAHDHKIKGNDVIYYAYNLKREADLKMSVAEGGGSFEYDDTQKGWYNVKVTSVKVLGNKGYFAGKVVKASNPTWVNQWLFGKVIDNGNSGDQIWGSFTDMTSALDGVENMSDPADGPFTVTKKNITVN